MKPTKLIYDDAAHAYWVDGKRWSGASNYGGQIENQSSLINWGKRQAARGVALDDQLRQEILLNLDDDAKLDRLAEKALTVAGANKSRDRGSEIHRITEQHDKGRLPVLTPDMLDVVTAWEQVLEQHGIEILTDHIERIVVHPEFKVCGTFDRIAHYNGRLVVLDLKTGKRTKFMHTMCIQLALLASAPWITRDGIVHGEKVTFTEFDPMPEVDQEIGLIVSMPSDGSEPAVYELPLADGLRAARLAKEAKEWTSREVGRVLVAAGGGVSQSTAGTTVKPPTSSTQKKTRFAASATPTDGATSRPRGTDGTQGRGGSSIVTASAATPLTDDPFDGIATEEKAVWVTKTGLRIAASTAAPSSASDPAPAGSTPGAAKTSHDAQRAELQRRIDAVKANPAATEWMRAQWKARKLPPWPECPPSYYGDVAGVLLATEAHHEIPFDPPVAELPDLPPEPVKPAPATINADDIADALAAVAALDGPRRLFWNAMTSLIKEAGHTIDPRKGPEAERPRRLEILRALLAWCEHHDEELLRAGLALCLGDDAVQPAFSTGALLASLKLGEARALRKVAEGLGSTFVEHVGADGVVELRRAA